MLHSGHATYARNKKIQYGIASLHFTVQGPCLIRPIVLEQMDPENCAKDYPVSIARGETEFRSG